MKLFELVGSIKIDDKDSSKVLDNVDKKAGGIGKKLGGMAKTAGKWGAGIAAGVGAAAGAIGGMVVKATDGLDEIHKGSSRMGVSTDAYQEMEYWASQNGLAQADMEKAAGRLNQRIGMAADGNEKYANALEAVGVNMEDVKNGTISTEDAFATSIQTLSEMENSQERAAMASELFGTKLGRELLPALEDGSLSFEDAKKKAEELGLVLDEDAVEAGANFTDTLDNIQRSFGSVVTKIGIEVMPMVQEFLDWVLDNMPQIQAVMSTVFNVISTVVTIAVDVFRNHLLPVFKGIFDWVSENWPAIQAIIESVFKAIKIAWDNVLKPVFDIFLAILETLINFIADNFPSMLSVVESVFEGIGTAVEAVTGFFGGLIDKVKSAWEWLTKWNRTDAKDKTVTTHRKTIDGSHRSGLGRVPFDGYVAELHRGEEVLTANDPRNRNNNKGMANSSTVNHTGTIRVEGVNNRGELVAVVEQEIGKNIHSDSRRLPDRPKTIPI